MEKIMLWVAVAALYGLGASMMHLLQECIVKEDRKWHQLRLLVGDALWPVVVAWAESRAAYEMFSEWLEKGKRA